MATNAEYEEWQAKKDAFLAQVKEQNKKWTDYQVELEKALARSKARVMAKPMTEEAAAKAQAEQISDQESCEKARRLCEIMMRQQECNEDVEYSQLPEL